MFVHIKYQTIQTNKYCENNLHEASNKQITWQLHSNVKQGHGFIELLNQVLLYVLPNPSNKTIQWNFNINKHQNKAAANKVPPEKLQWNSKQSKKIAILGKSLEATPFSRLSCSVSGAYRSQNLDP